MPNDQQAVATGQVTRRQHCGVKVARSHRINPVDDQHADPIETSPVCYRHPDRPTGLSCTECGKPICPECSHDAAVGQKCAECSRPVGRARVITARNMATSTPVVTVILALTVVAFLAQGTSQTFERALIQFNPDVHNGELWRMLTAAFLHANFIHIGFNMYVLWILGPSLERQLGSAPFAALYGATALAGGAAFLLFGGPFGAALGASGAIFGLFGALFAASYRGRHTAAGDAQFRRIVSLLALNLLLPLIVPRIAWQAHLGGLAAGAAIMFIWLKMPRGPRVGLARTAVALAVAGLALVVGVLA